MLDDDKEKEKDFNENQNLFIKQFIILLSKDKDYSKVLTLSNLKEIIISSNEHFKKNILRIDLLMKDEVISFNDFISKSIICFPNFSNVNFDIFISEISNLNSVSINNNFTLLNLLSESISFLGNESSNYSQCGGFKISSIFNNNSNSLFKNFSNRLINTRNFEILRLLLGDYFILFLFKYCSMFIYDEKALNYIQVLGYSLKTKLYNLCKIPPIEKTNYFFQKIFSAPIEEEKPSQKMKIPYNYPFIVERTKIYYCANFNRKLGFFKKFQIKSINNLMNEHYDSINKTIIYSQIVKDSFAYKTYNNLFYKNDTIKVYTLIPDSIKDSIVIFINQISENICNFDYPKELFKFCPIIKDWKKLKNDIKSKIKIIEETTNEEKKMETYSDLMEQLKILINSNIPTKNIYYFTCYFIKTILPRKMLGNYNMKILIQKISSFISMNRFETFNRVNLFDSKEFSFKDMKWLEFKNFSKKKFANYGILLKNFIMKSLIHWIFNFVLVQFFRSHFFITEKQGDHFLTLYYHKIIYDLIIKICYNKYTCITKQYEPSNKKEAFEKLTSISSAPGKLRLMPKPSTMRPITSFKKKTLGQNKNFLKNILFDTQKIFKYIQNKMQKNKNNCVIFDYKEIIKRLMDYKLRLIKCNKNSQIIKETKLKNSKITKYLSYVTMDIEACYDNIDIQLLNNFIERDDTIGSTYVTGILYILIPKINKTKNPLLHIDIKDCFDIKLMYIVSDLREYIHILDYLEKREEMAYKNCIIYIDNSKLVYLSKAQFMPTVKNIINNNYIKFDKKFLRQTKGIPQGLSVSSFLCNLFFYEIEQDLSFEIQKIVNFNQSLLLRFMDDYLCLSNSTEKTIIFKDSSIDLSAKNKFNFNLKKLQSNLNDIIVSDKDNNDLKKFSWNGMFFQLDKKYYFNLIYDNNKSDENDKLINYTKLVNINLPLIKNKNDFTWLVKKINGVLFSGHPWIYFMSTINEKEILEKNFESLIKFMFFKLLVLIRKIENTSLKPSQKNLINVIDTFMMKMYSFLDSKVFEIEKKKFYISYEKFHNNFYKTMFKIYLVNGKQYNQKIVKYSPLLFKTIKRKIERLKCSHIEYPLKQKYKMLKEYIKVWNKS